MGQQSDPNSNNKMRWVLPYTKEERCSCTKVMLGGVNTSPPEGAEDHFYTDEPYLFVNNHDVNNLREMLGCLDENGMLTLRTRALVLMSKIVLAFSHF